MTKNNNPVTLPPFTVKRVVSTLTQSMGWQIVNTSVPNIWNVTQGEGIKICIIDTGCPVTKKNGQYIVHPDLIGAIDVENSKSFVQDEGIEDMNGHSSHCCGIIAMQNNVIGGVGVAPKVMITTYKALDKDGCGGMDQINDALEEAGKHDFNIISMSLGCPFGDDRMHNLIKQLTSKNVVIVTAAGNDGVGSPINYPGAYSECIAVGAYDKNDNLAGFSCSGENLAITAPGVDIYSTYLNGSYAVLSGTSMATPFMAAVIALLLSKHHKQEQTEKGNDCVTVDQVKEHIKKYANDKGIIGKDMYWGYGIVDVDKMIEAQEEAGIVITPDQNQFDNEANATPWQKVKNWLWEHFVKPL